ncbi:MAG: pirin family protein [Gracilibacteraceae bacterium]|jgi:redox-sensitive bicupin YhaK (pirin superfamily)|nr:pirin family protein [Gracilibacteraceae bacterium]
MGRARNGWLDSRHHFSFDQYYNPANMNFGVLRVLNDDRVQAGEGFDTHPHRDMEIISYVVEGELTHRDSMGNARTLTRGQVQYMSAGTGVFHSELNLGSDLLRFLQIWFPPDRAGYQPNYGDFPFVFADRLGRWLPLATSYQNEDSAAPIRIHADVNLFAGVAPAGGELDFSLRRGRQAYVVNIEGCTAVGALTLQPGDALELMEEEARFRANGDFSHLLLIEMKKP